LKSLLLIRHAKSDWADASLKDFDRPLNDRGKRDAPVMAHRLLDKKVKIDAFISSPAKRVKKQQNYSPASTSRIRKISSFSINFTLQIPKPFLMLSHKRMMIILP